MLWDPGGEAQNLNVSTHSEVRRQSTWAGFTGGGLEIHLDHHQSRLAVIPLDDSHPSFLPNRRTGMDALRAKLLAERSLGQGTMLYQIFLCLRKAYGTFSRSRTLDILEAYRGGPTSEPLGNTWDGLQLVLHRSCYYSNPIPSCCGVTQEDTFLPIIFNLVVAKVVRSRRNARFPDAEAPVEALLRASMEKHDKYTWTTSL
jgi:hypothetical protein